MKQRVKGSPMERFIDARIQAREARLRQRQEAQPPSGPATEHKDNK